MKSRWLAYSLLLVGWLSIGYACKGGGGGGGEFIMVLNTSPEDGRNDVQLESRVGFQIDATIDPATLTNDTFYVTDSQGTRIAGTLAIDEDEPDVAVLTPAEPFLVIASFTATITTGLASSRGATLEQNFEWQFTTLDSAWGVSEWIEQIDTGSSSRAQVVVDEQSNALAVWEYNEPTGTSIWANHYTRVGLWEEPVPIDTGNGGATDPQVAADAAGNGFAVWREDQNGGEIWTNRYVVGQGWGTAELLQTGEVTAAQNPAIAADREGNAVAIWFQRDRFSADVVVWANRYDAVDDRWGSAQSIDTMTSPSAGVVTAVGMDGAGDAIAIWTRPTFMGTVIWANRNTSTGWGTSELIKSDDMTDARAARLDVGANGDAFVVWEQDEDTREDIWSTRFSGSSWSAPERIDTHTGSTIEPDVAVDGNGVAHAVWSQSDVDFRNIYARQYTPGSGWGTPELIEPENVDPTEDADATAPRVEVNTAGNAFVVWRQTFADWGSIWSNRLDPDTGWMTAQLIEQITRAAAEPVVAVDENRHAHAVWLHNIDRGVDGVRTNRFE